MRMSIEIEDRLMAEAMAAAGVSTEHEAVEMALRLLARRRQASARELFGKVDWRGDLPGNAMVRGDGLPQGHDTPTVFHSLTPRSCV